MTRNALYALAVLIALLCVGTFMTGTPTAQATPTQDADYVACLAYEGIYNQLGPNVTAAIGRGIATAIAGGISPLDERDWVYQNSPASISIEAANVMVNCATVVWLGFGPPSDGSVLR